MTALPDLVKSAKRIVIKIGSVLVTDIAAGKVREDWLATLSNDIAVLQAQGKEIILVSSGAVALGRKPLGLSTKAAPGAIPLAQKQAASAVGQFHIFAAYHQAFSKCGLQAAQILLTINETENRRTHINARATLETLIASQIIPIINENDAIATGELRFGDNDRLAVRVGLMIDADLVILLSTTDGLYSADPHKDKNAEHYPFIEDITEAHLQMAGDAVPGLSTGGMKSKIEAARAATQGGIPLVIGNGIHEHALSGLINGQTRATIFQARDSRNNARKRWIEAHLNPKGAVHIDDGALNALNKGKSLLPVGITKTEGIFERGDVITVKNAAGQKIAIGIAAYSTSEAKNIIGQSSEKIQTLLGYTRGDAFIHRNDMVLNS